MVRNIVQWTRVETWASRLQLKRNTEKWHKKAIA